MRSNFRRVPVQPQVRQQMQSKTFPAPTRGWIANENLMMAQPGGATMLENWFPTQVGIAARGGSRLEATIGEPNILVGNDEVPLTLVFDDLTLDGDPLIVLGEGPGATTSMFSFVAGATKRLFAANETKVFEVTSVEDPKLMPTPAVTGQTSGYYSTVQFGNVGQTSLYAVNGTDDPLRFDGENWMVMDEASTPSISGALGLNQVWKYRRRLFFTQLNSMDVWYLQVDAIGGELVKYPLGGVFQRGGSVLFGATWSVDAGDGMDDKCVFVTTEGEVAVYQGADPGNIADWSIVGRYDMSRPLGKNAWFQVGGDLMIMAEEGIFPMSAIQSKDPAALSLSAITRAIEPEWKKEVETRRGLPWEIIKWVNSNLALITLPTTEPTDPYCFVVNLETGAWAKYTGWDTRCATVFDGRAYFGTSDGRVLQAEIGASDDGKPYVCTCVSQFDHLDVIGNRKQVHMVRSVFRSSLPFVSRISMSRDYSIKLPTPPNPVSDGDLPGLWDVGKWDQSAWDSKGFSKEAKTKWASIGQSGHSVAPQIQITFQGGLKPDVELVGFDVTYEVGGLVV